MKNTKMRKKMLISSLAMLMVATVSLGSATYAWFTSSTTATASQINVKTIKSSELVISKLDKNWGTTVKYGVGFNGDTATDAKILMPVSTADGKSWYKATADANTAYTAKAGSASIVETSEKGNYYFAQQLNVKNNGEADVENVTITFSIDNTSTKTGYYRIALVPVTDNDENTTSLPDVTADTFFANKKVNDSDTLNTLTNVFGLADTDGYQALTGTDVSTNLSAKVKPNTASSVTVGTLKGTGATLKGDEKNAAYYNLYVWFEGQDIDCKDANAGAARPNITFTVTGQTVNQA